MTTPLERVFRDEWGRVLATLIGLLGEVEIAEEAGQGGDHHAPVLAEDAVERGHQ